MALIFTIGFSSYTPYVKAHQNKTHKIEYTNESFSEKHPVVYKTFKLLLKASIGTAVMVGLYYGANLALDKLIPGREEKKRNIFRAENGIKNATNELLTLNEIENPTQQDKEKIMFYRSKISDYNDVLDRNKESNFDAIKKVSGIGGALAVAKFGIDTLNEIGKVAESTMYISCFEMFNDKFKKMGQSIKEYFETPMRNRSKSDVYSNFDKLFANLEGQEEAKHDIKNYIYDIVIAKDQAKWANEKYSHSDVLYFYGPSGVGKSFSANCLPYILYSKAKPFVLTSADVDKEKKESIVSQIFSPSNQAQQNPGVPGYKSDSALVDYLRKNPGGGVVIFEEYDKMCTPALDEVMRKIAESGTIIIDGVKIDCSGFTFVLTSNEDDISMNGFDKEDKESEEKLSKEAIQEGYTRVWHSKSFLNRVKKVRFENLSSKEYEKIITKRFNTICEYWKDTNNGGLKLSIDDTTIHNLAMQVEKTKQGARPIDLKIMPEIQSIILEKIKSALSMDYYHSKKLTIYLDSGTNKLAIKE